MPVRPADRDARRMHVMPPRTNRTRRVGAVGAAIVLVVLALGCAAAPMDGATDAPGSTTDAATSGFCEQWEAAWTAGDGDRLETLLAAPPTALADLAAQEDPRFLGELDLLCHPMIGVDGADVADRRVGPPLADLPPALAVCSAGPAAGATSVAGGVVLYGDGRVDDPYREPMVGVAWGPEGTGFVGDGDPTAVVVRGVDGTVAPITVFQQVVLPELGLVVTWREGDQEVALYGRGWGSDRQDELVALADQVEVVDGGFRLPESARPEGAVEVFAGGMDSLGLLFPPPGAHGVELRPDAGATQLTVSTFVAAPEAFEAVRFLALDLERTTDDDRTTLRGSAWSAADGPAVLTWREPDGLVVRVVGSAVGPEVVDQLAAVTRDLTAVEWTELVARSGTCPESHLPPPG